MTESMFQKALHGRSAHVDTALIFDGLDWQSAGKKPEHCPHSVWELLYHMNYWQDFMLGYLKGDVVKAPDHPEESWPVDPMPESRKSWEYGVERFLKGLKEAEQEAGKDLAESGFSRPGRTRGDLLMVMINHNSYHAGQVITTRSLIGTWPPQNDYEV